MVNILLFVYFSDVNMFQSYVIYFLRVLMVDSAWTLVSLTHLNSLIFPF